MQTTHHPDHALAIADDALMLLDSGQALVGPAGEILDETKLSRLYGVRIHRLPWRVGPEAGDIIIPLHGLAAPAAAG